MPKLQQMSSSGQYFLILPKPIVRAKGWQKGEEIRVEIDTRGNLLLKI